MKYVVFRHIPKSMVTWLGVSVDLSSSVSSSANLLLITSRVLSMGTLVKSDCTSKLVTTSFSVTDSKETISENCLVFFTKDEVPIRGEMMEVLNLARWYVGEPMAEKRASVGCLFCGY